MSADEGDKLAFLKFIGADRARHSGRTLYDHLIGTQALLRRWGCSQVVQDAGLMHSVLGTRRFLWCPDTIDIEARLAAMVSADALRLIKVFSLIRDGASLLKAWRTGVLTIRSAGVDEELSIEIGELEALILVEAANLLDQGTGRAFMLNLLAADVRRAVVPRGARGDLEAFLERTRMQLPPYTGDEVLPEYLYRGSQNVGAAVWSHCVTLRGADTLESKERHLTRALMELG